MVRDSDPVIARPIGNIKAIGQISPIYSDYTTVATIVPSSGKTFDLAYLGVSALDDVWCRLLIGNTIASPDRFIAGNMHKQIFFPYGIFSFTGDGNTGIFLQLKIVNSNTYAVGEMAGEEV